MATKRGLRRERFRDRFLVVVLFFPSTTGLALLERSSIWIYLAVAGVFCLSAWYCVRIIKEQESRVHGTPPEEPEREGRRGAPGV